MPSQPAFGWRNAARGGGRLAVLLLPKDRLRQDRARTTLRADMSAIQFECPLCHEVNEGDESQYGQRVTCRKCHQTIRVPSPPAAAEPPTARLIKAGSAGPAG